MQSLQIESQDNIKNLKGWQAEAYISVLLFCCTNLNSSIISGWNLSKVCALYELVGDIFTWDVVKKLEPAMRLPEIDYKKIDTLKTNLRLLPKESHAELLEMCTFILSKGGTKEDEAIKRLIVAELAD